MAYANTLTASIPPCPASFIGSWTAHNEDNGVRTFSLTFYENNTYFHWETGTTAACASDGIEIGTYTYNESTDRLSINVTSDENGCAGLSDDDGEELRVRVSGNSLVCSESVDGYSEGDVLLVRVKK